ncbi:hypothetical protein CYMTET_32792, partial [Cymbomonas tetramitiformis]
SELVKACCWALGNIAVEGAALCARLHANGALRPLALLAVPKGAKGALRCATLTQTAAWALSNIVCGGAEAAELLEIPGFVEGLAAQLADAEHCSETSAAELAWVIVALVAAPGSEPRAYRLLQGGIATAFADRLQGGASLTAPYVVPFIRALGYLVGTCSPASRPSPPRVAGVFGSGDPLRSFLFPVHISPFFLPCDLPA